MAAQMNRTGSQPLLFLCREYVKVNEENASSCRLPCGVNGSPSVWFLIKDSLSTWKNGESEEEKGQAGCSTNWLSKETGNKG